MFGYANELDCSKSHRRPGSQTGPGQFCRVVKFSPLRAINDHHTAYIDCFEYMGVDSEQYKAASYIGNLNALHEHCRRGDLKICIGGDNSALSVMAQADPDFDVLIKISPNLSRGICEKEEDINHQNYVSCINETLRPKIVHFGILDYTCSNSEVRSVIEEDKAKIVYLDKFEKSNLKAFSELLSNFSSTTKIGVMIDCESLNPDYFPGVTTPSVFGLQEKEIFGIMEKLGSSDINLKILLFTNFNPTVESRRTGDVLTYLIHTLLSKISNKATI